MATRRKMVIPPMPTGNAPPVPRYVNVPNNEFNLNTIRNLRSKRELYSSNTNEEDIKNQENARNHKLLKLYGLNKTTSKSTINPNKYDSFFLPKPSKLQSSNFPKSMIANNNDPFANYNAPVSNPFMIDPKLSINDTPKKSKRLPPLTNNPLFKQGGRRKTKRNRKQKTRRHRKH